MVKNLPANAGDAREEGLIPGLGRSPGGGHGNPLQYSCLKNPMDREAWWATVHTVAKNGALLSDLAQHSTGEEQLSREGDKGENPGENRKWSLAENSG